MDYQISEKELPSQLALTHRAPVTMATIGAGIGAAFGVLGEHAGRTGAQFAGPYGEVGKAYTTLQKWMTDNGRRPAGMVREVYLNDPGAVPAEELLTEIDWPIA